MAKKTTKKKTSKTSTIDPPKGLGVELSLSVDEVFNGQRLRVDIKLTQDGEEIASDYDWVHIKTLP